MAEQSTQQPSFAPSDTVSKVELSLSCSNLQDLDFFSKSDPVVFLYEKKGREWFKLGRTEVIDNNLNPKVSWGSAWQHRLSLLAAVLLCLSIAVSFLCQFERNPEVTYTLQHTTEAYLPFNNQSAYWSGRKSSVSCDFTRAF